jgi:hypothetical protein
MAPQLGQTTDPKELIPGEPAQIAADLRAMVDTVQRMDTTGGHLGRIDTPQWHGEASTAFHTSFGKEPPRWTKAADLLAEGGQSLAGYGDVLAWGQGQAHRAIELYTQAQAATRNALAQHDKRVEFGTAGPFVDPGAVAAREAQAILDTARGKVAQAASDAAAALGFEPDGSGGYKKTFGDNKYGTEADRRKQMDPRTGKEDDPGGWQRTRSGRTYQRERGSQSDDLLTDMLGNELNELGINLPTRDWTTDGHVELAGASLEGGFDKGPFSAHGSVSGSLLGADGEAHAGVNPLGVNVGASGEVYLGRGSLDGEVHLGKNAGLAGDLTGTVGADGNAQGTIGLLGGQGDAEVFAGGKVSGNESAEVAGVTVGAHGEARAGIGAGASAQFNMGDDGKLHVGASLSAALGIGGSVGFDISIDPDKVTKTFDDLAKGGWNMAGDVGRGAENLGKKAVSGVLHTFGIG